MHEDGEFLDGQYAAFGKVLEGMDVVDKIAAVKTDGNDRPLSRAENRLDPRRHKGRGIPLNPTSSATRTADFNIKKGLFPAWGKPAPHMGLHLVSTGAVRQDKRAEVSDLLKPGNFFKIN